MDNNEIDKYYIGRLSDDFALRSPRYQSPTFKTYLTGDEEDHPVFGLERDWVYACEHFLDRYRKTEDDWTPEKETRLRRAIKESIRAYAGDMESARFLDMSQFFSLKVPLIREISSMPTLLSRYKPRTPCACGPFRVFGTSGCESLRPPRKRDG